MFNNFDLITILLTLPGIIIGLTFHEYAHAFASDRLGDPTPRSQGRLTLSPLPHIDPIGLLFIIVARFGWAKPVEINPRYYKNPRRDEILVSIAGPAANLLIAVVLGIIIRFVFSFDLIGFLPANTLNNLKDILFSAVLINIMLFVFNLLPIPPLDGFHILSNVLHPRHYEFLYRLKSYGFIILIILIATGITRYIVGYPVHIIYLLLRLVIGF